MSSIWIKICGITRAEDALAASNLGVDAIGLVFYPPSPRAIPSQQVASVLADIDDSLNVFALFVDPTRQQVQAVLDAGRIDHLQFHGVEPAAFCASFGLPYMKAVRVQSADSAMREIENYEGAEYVLLDSYEKNVPGGTGKTFDWVQAQQIVAHCGHRIVLAGGLNSDNVAAAIATVHPFGVDVSSGVEAQPGRKDLDKLQSFVKGVRGVRS